MSGGVRPATGSGHGFTIVLPHWQASKSGTAEEHRGRVDVTIPEIAPAAAPVVMKVSIPHGRRTPIDVRRHGDRLLAPLSASTDGQVAVTYPDPLRNWRDAAMRPEDLSLWLGGGPASVNNPFLGPHRLPPPPNGPKEAAAYGETSVLFGMPLHERVRKRAAEDFAFVGGRLHMKVFEPVWQVTIGLSGYTLDVAIPTVEAEEAHQRVRYDERQRALAYLPETIPVRRRRTLYSAGIVGSVEMVGAGHVFCRDDARLTAIDIAGRMLAETSGAVSEMDDGHVRAWFALRDAMQSAVRCEPDSGPACFAAADALAEAFATKKKTAERDHAFRAAVPVIAQMQRLSLMQRAFHRGDHLAVDEPAPGMAP